VCGRFTSTTPPAVLAERFGVEEVRIEEEFTPRWNVAPSLGVLAVAPSRSAGRRRLGTFRWGLVPSWAKDPSVGNRMINARAEGIATKAAFRKALARHRCIIPADAFYEWKRVGPKGRQPYAVSRRDGDPLALAGLWEMWHDPDDLDGPPLRSCTIVTTEANELLSPVHDRMPVVLPPGAWDTWLDPAVEDLNVVKGLLVPLPSSDLAMWPVRPLVNRVDHEGPELVEPLDEVPEAERQGALEL